VRFGVHLPQSGRAASGANIARCARQAEELGFADVWVSDHIAVPTGAPYPPPFLFEPLLSLSWAAAATSRIGLGTSIYILPLRPVLSTSKALTTLDLFSGGRLTVGAGAGWLQAEFDAVGVKHSDRQAITDEYIDDLRTSWTTRPFDLTGDFTRGEKLIVLPQPGREIPIWVGGMGALAVRRALGKGDGWHGYGPLGDVCTVASTLRESRPTESFTLSVRVDWDGLTTDSDDIARELAALTEAGLQHIVACPAQSNIDDWLRSVESLARTFALI
jgi:probable F420-dependent oxidoreductase